tara:strand:- start:508 stop:1941 length:1434 start_codon:yes stop_codon:yes gene_type:complete
MESISINLSDTNDNNITPKLSVLESNDIGTLNIKEISTPKKVNFGPGAEMLMNTKKKTDKNISSDIKLDDIDKLDDDIKINNISDINDSKPKKSDFSSIFSNPFSKNDDNNDLETINISDNIISGNNSIFKPVPLNNASNPNAKTSTNDGFKKFNNIPINPDVDIKPKSQLSDKEILREKVIYLRKLEALEKKGIQVTKKHTIDSQLDEIKGEYELIKSELEKKNSVKFQGKMLMAFVSGVEYLNQKFDPFDINLDGWGENVNENLEEYDEIFGELHEKYASKAKIAPELKLLFTLAGSGLMLHMTNTMFKSSMPGMDDIMRQNPELMQQFTQAAVNTMSNDNPGFGNFMQNMMPPQQQQPPMGSPPGPTEEQRRNPPRFDSRPDITMSRNTDIFNDGIDIKDNKKSIKSSRNEMKGPSDLRDILSGLKTKKISIKDNNSTTSLSDLKDSHKDLDGKQPKKSRRKPKSERNTVTLNL